MSPIIYLSICCLYISDTKAKLVLSSPLEVNQKKLNLALYMHLDLKFNRPLRL